MGMGVVIGLWFAGLFFFGYLEFLGGFGGVFHLQRRGA